MILKTKKTLLRKPLFLLTAASAFVLSTAIGYCADESADRANVTMRHTPTVAPKPLVTLTAEGLKTEIRQQDKRFLLPDCWKGKYSTVPMMALKTKKILIRNPFLLTAASAFVWSRAMGYCIDEPFNPARGATVPNIPQFLPKSPMAPVAEGLAGDINPTGQKVFPSLLGEGKIWYGTYKSKKKIPPRSRFLLAGASAFALSTATAYCADERTNRAKDNATVRHILEVEPPITLDVAELAAKVRQQNKKFFLSYCWSEDYSTAPMVDNFAKFIKKLDITSYLDKHEEVGVGMTLGTHIGDFMKKAGESDIVVVFLNDAYFRSRSCMYEFFEIWDVANKKMKPNVFIIRHPDFGELFGGPDASQPYIDHWRQRYNKLAEDSKRADGANKKRYLDEMELVIKIETNISPIIEYVTGYILADYRKQHSKGFEDVFKLALKHNAKGLQEDAKVAAGTATQMTAHEYEEAGFRKEKAILDIRASTIDKSIASFRKLKDSKIQYRDLYRVLNEMETLYIDRLKRVKSTSIIDGHRSDKQDEERERNIQAMIEEISRCKGNVMRAMSMENTNQQPGYKNEARNAVVECHAQMVTEIWAEVLETVDAYENFYKTPHPRKEEVEKM